MAALATVEVHHETARAPKQVRISARVKTAIEQMVDHGRNRAEAAQIAGIADDSLYRALTKPEVLAYRNHRMRVIRESAASRTIAKAEALMDSAESEHVKLDATKWIAGLEGISPVSKSESVINHKGLGPGLVIQISAPTIPQIEGRVIGGQQSQAEFVSREKHLSLPVPHPAWGNPEISGDPGRPESEGEGEKSRRARSRR